jgi:hypothetical protein
VDENGKSMNINSAIVQFNPNRINLQEFKATTGKSDMNVTGVLENFYGFIFRNQNLQGNFNNFWNTTTTTLTLNAAEPQHIAVAWTASSKTAAIYVNGTNVTGTRTVSTQFVGPTSADIVTVVVGPIQQICIWTYAVTQATFQAIYKLSTAVFYETTAARVARIIAETPFSTSLVSANGTQYIAGITDDAPFAGPELQITANTEGGPLYVDKTGVLTQTATYTQFTQTKSFNVQATYGSGGLGLGQNISLQYDGDSMRNEADVAGARRPAARRSRRGLKAAAPSSASMPRPTPSTSGRGTAR